MKIAIIHDCIYPWRKGGGEVRNHHLSRQLAKMGHEVLLVGMKDWDGPDRRELEPGITAVGISVGLALYDQTGKRSLYDAISFAQACAPERLDELVGKVDIVEANNIPYFHLANVSRWAKSQDIPMMVTWHEVYGYKHWRKERNPIIGAFAAFYENRAMSLGDYLIAVSNHTRGRLMEKGVKEERIKVVYAGMDVDAIANTSPGGPESDLIYSARLVPTKRTDLLLSASELAGKKLGRPIKGIVTGDGPQKDQLKRQAYNMQVDFHFTGWLPEPSEVWAHMKKSKIMVHTSEREGFGFAALEAMACGLPVVAMDQETTAVKEFVEEGKTGYKVEPDPESISDAIITAISNHQSMADNCRDYARGFSWSSSGENLIAAYRSA